MRSPLHKTHKDWMHALLRAEETDRTPMRLFWQPRPETSTEVIDLAPFRTARAR